MSKIISIEVSFKKWKICNFLICITLNRQFETTSESDCYYIKKKSLNTIIRVLIIVP